MDTVIETVGHAEDGAPTTEPGVMAEQTVSDEETESYSLLIPMTLLAES